MVFLKEGGIPEGHDSVADEFVYGAFGVDDRFGHDGEVFVDEVDEVFWTKLF